MTAVMDMIDLPLLMAVAVIAALVVYILPRR